MQTVLVASSLSVLKVFLVCAAGAWLARSGIMHRDFRRSLSRIVLMLMLPCLLITKLSVSANPANLMRWSLLPVAGLIYVAFGLLLGRLTVWLRNPPPEHRRIVAASVAFGNSGYIPYPLIMALAGTAPLFAGDATAGDRGIVYVSLFLVGMTPCLWGIGFPFLAHEPLHKLKLKQIFSPPVVSVFAGIGIGLFPPLRQLLVDPEAPLRILFDTAELVGTAAIPCALLILGANLGDIHIKEKVSPATGAAVITARLIIMPLFAIFFTLSCARLGWLPDDPMFALVLMLEGAVPPATNLIVMCQVHHQGEAPMSKILVWSYIAAIPTLTCFTAIVLWLAGNL